MGALIPRVHMALNHSDISHLGVWVASGRQLHLETKKRNRILLFPPDFSVSLQVDRAK